MLHHNQFLGRVAAVMSGELAFSRPSTRLLFVAVVTVETSVCLRRWSLSKPFCLSVAVVTVETFLSVCGGGHCRNLSVCLWRWSLSKPFCLWRWSLSKPFCLSVAVVTVEIFLSVCGGGHCRNLSVCLWRWSLLRGLAPSHAQSVLLSQLHF